MTTNNQEYLSLKWLRRGLYFACRYIPFIISFRPFGLSAFVKDKETLNLVQACSCLQSSTAVHNRLKRNGIYSPPVFNINNMNHLLHEVLAS